MMLHRLILYCALLANLSVFATERMTGWDDRFYRLDLGFGLLNGSGLQTVPGIVAATDSGEFLVGGRFTNIQGKAFLNLALWNGRSWEQPLPDGKGEIEFRPSPFSDRTTGIFALATRGAEIFVGGNGLTRAGGTTMSNIAWWTGTNWLEMSGGTTGKVSALLIEGTRLYAGGKFESIGGVTATNVAVWDGTQWHAVGDGLPFEPNSLVMHKGNLFAAGTDTNALHRLLRWNETAWESVGNAFDQDDFGEPLTLLSRPEGLYVGGIFTNVAGVTSTNVAVWNGASWESPAGGISYGPFLGRISALTTWRNQVLAGGFITGTNSFERFGPALWDGTKWTTMSNCPVQIMLNLVASGEKLFARGKVDTGVSLDNNGAAYFDGERWMALGQGLTMFYRSAQTKSVHLVAHEKGMLLAGNWTEAENLGRLVRWNGELWEQIMMFPNALPRDFTAIATQGDLIWAGTDSPTWRIPSNRFLAATDEANWFSAGTSTPGAVRDIQVVGGKVYVAGDFGIGMWNGSQIVAAAPGYSLRALAVAADEKMLYVAGTSQAGGRISIDQFDGRAWRTIAENLPGQSLSSQPIGLKMVDGNLYAYGNFGSIGGKSIAAVAMWDGEEWTSVGDFQRLVPFTEPWITEVVPDGRGALYFTGQFAVEGATNLARLRNGQFTKVGNEEIGFGIDAAEWNEGGLHIAGILDRGDPIEPKNFAIWHDPDAAVEAMILAATNVVSGSTGEVRLRLVNLRSTNVIGVRVSLSLSEGVTVAELPANASVEGTNLVWQLASVVPGKSEIAVRLRFQSELEREVRFEASIQGADIPLFRTEPAWTTIWNGNIPPTISLSVPIGTTILPAPVVLSAQAADADGTVSRVEYYAGTNLIGTDLEAPYEIQWTNAPAGTHFISAAAIDNGGKKAMSLRLLTTVVARPSNDSFANRITLTNISGTISGNAKYATSDPTDPAGYQNTVWYEWRPGQAGLVTIRPFPSYVAVAIYRGLTTMDPPVTTADSSAPFPLQIKLRDDETFLILAGGPNVADFSLGFEWRELPKNDDFESAAVISGFEPGAQFDVFGATIQADEPFVTELTGQRTLWYKWTAPMDGRVVFENHPLVNIAFVSGTNFASLKPVPITTRDPALPPAWPDYTVRGGETYYLQVDSRFNDPLGFTLYFLPEGGRIRKVSPTIEGDFLVDFAGYDYTEYAVEKSRDLKTWETETVVTNITQTSQFRLPRSSQDQGWFWRTRFVKVHIPQ